jgi:Putative zinc-finger
MTTLLSCAAVRRRLDAYHDGELPVRDQIAVDAHLEGCPPCRAESEVLSEVGESLRRAAALQALPPSETAGLASSVVSRLDAENEQSLSAQVRRAFEDMHFVWAGLSAAGATVVCAALLFAIGYFAPPERADSLAGVLSAMASPGSDRNPVRIDERISPPRVSLDTPMPAVLFNAPPAEDDLVLALAAVVTQEGRVRDPEVLLANHPDRATVERLMNAVVEARFQPASYGGAPVAVNFVWLLTHTTVRAKAHS